MIDDAKVFVGCKNGLSIYVAETLIAQVGLQAVTDEFRTTRVFPVKTGLSGSTVHVAANSQEEAVAKYLARKRKE
jgi:hypothetical protein